MFAPVLSRIRGQISSAMFSPRVHDDDYRRGVLNRNFERGAWWHEAGHAITYLAFGVGVLELRVGPSGGCCEVPRSAPADVDALACLCGPAAARMAGFGSGSSDVDRHVLHRALQRLRLTPGPIVVGKKVLFTAPPRRLIDGLTKHAEKFVAQHYGEIRELATQLARRGGYLNAAAIGQLTRQPGSPLAKYRHLYEQSIPAGATKSLEDVCGRSASACTPSPKSVQRAVCGIWGGNL